MGKYTRLVEKTNEGEKLLNFIKKEAQKLKLKDLSKKEKNWEGNPLEVSYSLTHKNKSVSYLVIYKDAENGKLMVVADNLDELSYGAWLEDEIDAFDKEEYKVALEELAGIEQE